MTPTIITLAGTACPVTPAPEARILLNLVPKGKTYE
jgi:hypothetical protein